MGHILLVLFLSTGLALNGSNDDCTRARGKIELIASDRAPRGSTIAFTAAEIDAYARAEIAREGMRRVKLVLGNGSATWSGFVEFAKIPELEGLTSNWLLRRLLEGEKPVTVKLGIESGNGQAMIDVRQVTISNTVIEGGTLDLLVKTLVLAIYPEASIGEPFELGHNMKEIRVQPSGVIVKIAD